MRKWIFYATLLFAFFTPQNCTLWQNSFPAMASESYEMPIRVLILKHSKEKMADDDAKLVLKAVEKASGQNLDVQAVGDHFVNNTKRIRIALHEYDEIANLRDFISEQFRNNACPDATFILFTVGHGSPSGGLDNLGQRAQLQTAIAEAAEENEQRVLWWQLSCYSAAKLPPIDTLTPRQQELLSVLNTSDEKTPSPAYIEGDIMEKMFASMINGEMDSDGNGEISGDEFRVKMNQIKKGRGDLFRSRDMSDPLFGVNLANRFVVFDVDKKRPAEGFSVPFPSKAIREKRF